MNQSTHALRIKEKANGPVFVDEITEQDLEDFMLYLKDERDFAPNSRSRYFYTLRSFYKYAEKKDIVEKDIAARMDPIRLPQKERVYLSEEEVMKVAEAIDIYIIKLIVLFLYNTGLRISECRDLKIEDVDLCAILSNSLDNAIEAACQVEDIQQRKIRLEIIEQGHQV